MQVTVVEKTVIRAVIGSVALMLISLPALAGGNIADGQSNPLVARRAMAQRVKPLIQFTLIWQAKMPIIWRFHCMLIRKVREVAGRRA